MSIFCTSKMEMYLDIGFFYLPIYYSVVCIIKYPFTTGSISAITLENVIFTLGLTIAITKAIKDEIIAIIIHKRAFFFFSFNVQIPPSP